MNANALPPKLQKLFEKTKPACFGRFLIDVPAEAEVVQGPQAFGPNIETVENGADSMHKLAETKRKELAAIRHEVESGTLLREFGAGPTAGSWLIVFRESPFATHTEEIWGYLGAKPHGFIYRGSTAPSDGRTLDTEKAKLLYLATHLRPRTPDEIPAEPGVCLELGFIADDVGKVQEIFGVGFRFPSLPDVSLSISSNKNGQTPAPLSERRKEAWLAVVGSFLEAPFKRVKVLREGRRPLGQWKGEEVLFRHPREKGGVWHEFVYDYPGIRYDRHNPRFDATLFTGVMQNSAGDQAASLSEQEAIALWDSLMSTLRLRVPAP